jgi:hypothetical protein
MNKPTPAIVDLMRKNGYLTAQDVSKKLGNSVYTIYQWSKDEKIKARKCNNTVFVEIQSLINFLGESVLKDSGIIS